MHRQLEPAEACGAQRGLQGWKPCPPKVVHPSHTSLLCLCCLPFRRPPMRLRFNNLHSTLAAAVILLSAAVLAPRSSSARDEAPRELGNVPKGTQLLEEGDRLADEQKH